MGTLRAGSREQAPPLGSPTDVQCSMPKRRQDPPSPQEQAATTLGSALTTTAIAVMTNGNPVVTGLGALVTGTVGFAVKTALAWKSRDVDRWWALVRGKDGDAFEQEVQSRVESPEVQDTILRSIRTVLDTVDPAAISPLARLSRWYLEEAKSPDPFFRCAARFLSEASAQELEQLREIVTWAVPLSDAKISTVHFFNFHDGANKHSELRLTEHLEQEIFRDRLEVLPWRDATPAGLFRSMELAGVSRIGRGRNNLEEASTDIERHTLVGLARIIVAK